MYIHLNLLSIGSWKHCSSNLFSQGISWLTIVYRRVCFVARLILPFGSGTVLVWKVHFGDLQAGNGKDGGAFKIVRRFPGPSFLPVKIHRARKRCTFWMSTRQPLAATRVLARVRKWPQGAATVSMTLAVAVCYGLGQCKGKTDVHTHHRIISYALATKGVLYSLLRDTETWSLILCTVADCVLSMLFLRVGLLCCHCVR